MKISDVGTAIREVEQRAKKPVVVQATQTIDDAFPHLSIPETLTLLLAEQRKTNHLLEDIFTNMNREQYPRLGEDE